MESCFAAFLNSLCALCPNIYPHYEEYMWCFSKLVSWKDREPGSVAETSGCPKYNLPISQAPVLPQGSCLSEYSTVHPLLTQDTRHPSSSLPSLSPDSHSTPMCWDGSGGRGETVLNFYLFSHWPLVSTTTPSPTNLIQAATICCLDAYNHFLPDLPASSLAPISFRFLQGNQNNVFKPQIWPSLSSALNPAKAQLTYSSSIKMEQPQTGDNTGWFSQVWKEGIWTSTFVYFLWYLFWSYICAHVS